MLLPSIMASSRIASRIAMVRPLAKPLLIRQFTSGRVQFISKTKEKSSKDMKNSKNEKDISETQSILTDDLLVRAGVDVNEADPKEDIENGEPKRRKRQTSQDIKREKYANWFYIFSLSSLLGTGLYMTRDWDSNQTENDIENGYTPELMYKRFMFRFNSLFKYFQDPPFPDLLPPPPPPPYQRPLTLVLSLEDLLVHSEWTQKGGWKTAKRPGVDYFLSYLSQYYEIVIFASNYMMYSEKIVEKLDPIHAFISYNLFKEHCLYKNGVHIKDLSKLNRDVKKVILVDCIPDNYSLQEENAIPMKPWDGEFDDKLIGLIPFLEYLATQQVDDVRPILNSFKDKYQISTEFNERVKKLREKFYKDQKKTESNWVMKILNGIGGIPKNNQYKFPLDMIRDEGEKNYVNFMKLVEEEKEKIRIQQEQLSSQTFTLKDYVEGNIPTPEEQMKLQMDKQKEIDQIFEDQKKKKEETK